MIQKWRRMKAFCRQQLLNEIGLDVLWDISGVNCAAHTLQLALKDALKKMAIQHQNIISLCHQVAKTMRIKSHQQSYKTETDGSSYTMPRLDVETRWGYTFLMVRPFS